METQTSGDTNVRRMFIERAPDHKPIEIRDTILLRSHIAILKKRGDEYRQLLQAWIKEMTCTRRTMMSDANDQEA